LEKNNSNKVAEDFAGKLLMRTYLLIDKSFHSRMSSLQFPCFACLEPQPFSAFSNKQLKKDTPQCKTCVSSGCDFPQVATVSNAIDVGFTQCSRCKSWKLGETFHGGLCVHCTENKEQRLPEEREVRRNAQELDSRSAGTCRVREVQRRYGYLCEIPLRAYQDAGIAENVSDYVTAQDVDRASDAWDARGIAHDIDTQWGSMPNDGAYSDSNDYYGSGEYDYY
jgi:hypothetical protein